MGCEAGRCNKNVINNLPHKKLYSIMAKYSDIFFLFFIFLLLLIFFDALKTGKNE